MTSGMETGFSASLVTYLLRHLLTYLQPRTHMGQTKLKISTSRNTALLMTLNDWLYTTITSASTKLS